MARRTNQVAYDKAWAVLRRLFAANPHTQYGTAMHSKGECEWCDAVRIVKHVAIEAFRGKVKVNGRPQ